MHDWIEALLAARGRGEPACMVTVAKVRGSAPREPGARMIVTPVRSFGTIGGGQLEHQCIRLAVEQLRLESSARRIVQRRYALGSNCGQCCGGAVSVLFEPMAGTHNGWLDAVQRAYADARPFVIVAGTNGARAVVTDDAVELFGACDAGALTVRARSMLRDSLPLDWSEHDGASMLMQRIAAGDFHVAVFGAGHVGSATVAALAPLGCTLRWIDGRQDLFPATLPRNVTAIASSDPPRDVLAMPAGAYYLVMTHSHALDFEIIAAVLGRNDAAYSGLIGSLSKRRRLERLLRAQEMTADRLSQLVCPIGIEGISGKRPAEIAVAVAADVLQVRSGRLATSENRRTNKHGLSWKPISLSG
jgi:xanthine dehydrogenase accessory factor